MFDEIVAKYISDKHFHEEPTFLEFYEDMVLEYGVEPCDVLRAHAVFREDIKRHLEDVELDAYLETVE